MERVRHPPHLIPARLTDPLQHRILFDRFAVELLQLLQLLQLRRQDLPGQLGNGVTACGIGVQPVQVGIE